MKKAIVTILLVMGFVLSAPAQVLKFGVKAGANYANLESAQLQTQALTSYHIGLVTQISLGNSLALQPELLYSTQGASYKYLAQEIKAELGYVSVPILAKVNLSKSFGVEVGPQFSFLASKNVTTATEVKDLDFGAAGGLFVNLTDRLFIQGRYVVGLTEIGKNADIKNSVGQLGIGFMF